MARPKNQWEADAAAMAARLNAARAAGQQLALFGDAGEEDGAVATGRGKGRSMSTLREILARRGLAMPEQVLANIAALDDPEGPVMAALKKAEAVAMAVYGHGQAPAKAKLDLFQMFYGHSLRALDALIPYGLAKVTPDAGSGPVVQVVVAGGQAPMQPVQSGDLARDVTPNARRVGPPPMPHDAGHQVVQNQGLSGSQDGGAD